MKISAAMPSLPRVPFVTTRLPLSRRRFLRGTGIALSLPFLESMLSGVARAAKADGPLAPGAKPRRMLAVCNNLGLLGDQFFPTGTGRDYVASPYLKPLQPHREDFSVFSGVSHPTSMAVTRPTYVFSPRRRIPAAARFATPFPWTSTWPSRSARSRVSRRSPSA